MEYLSGNLYGHWFFKFQIILAESLGRLGLPTDHPEHVEPSISFYLPHGVFTDRASSRLVMWNFYFRSLLTLFSPLYETMKE